MVTVRLRLQGLQNGIQHHSNFKLEEKSMQVDIQRGCEPQAKCHPTDKLGDYNLPKIKMMVIAHNQFKRIIWYTLIEYT